MNTITKTIFLQIGTCRYQVASYEQASRMFCIARDKSGEGASNTPTPQIVDEDGKVVAYISYNGRVWPGSEYVAGATPLCEAQAQSGQATWR